jgi:hypothetical protein
MKFFLPPDRSATLWQQISDAIAQQKFNPNNKTKNQFYENLETFWETASEPPKIPASVNTADSNFEQIKKLLILKHTQHPISDGEYWDIISNCIQEMTDLRLYLPIQQNERYWQQISDSI